MNFSIIVLPVVPLVCAFNFSLLFEFDPDDKSYDRFFSPSPENDEQMIKKGNRILTTNLTLEIQNQPSNLFHRSTNFSNSKLLLDTKKLETINPDKLSNLELWGVNIQVL